MASPLYPTLLGDDYAKLPAVIQRMHAVVDRVEARGFADITRGSSPLARLAAALLGLPPEGRAVPVHVTFTRDGDEAEAGERLIRRFGDAVLETRQSAGRGQDAGFLIEGFGPITLMLRLRGERAGLRFELVRVRLFGLPLPTALRPRLAARETVEDGWYHFSVDVALPLIGRLIRYEGRLSPDSPGARRRSGAARTS